MKILPLISVAAGMFLVGSASGFELNSVLNPQPGIEFDAHMSALISNDESVFWYTKINGHDVVCRDLRADDKVSLGVLAADADQGRLHVTIPSVSNKLITEDIFAPLCLVHSLEQE